MKRRGFRQINDRVDKLLKEFGYYSKDEPLTAFISHNIKPISSESSEDRIFGKHPDYQRIPKEEFKDWCVLGIRTWGFLESDGSIKGFIESQETKDMDTVTKQNMVTRDLGKLQIALDYIQEKLGGMCPVIQSSVCNLKMVSESGTYGYKILLTMTLQSFLNQFYANGWDSKDYAVVGYTYILLPYKE